METTPRIILTEFKSAWSTGKAVMVALGLVIAVAAGFGFSWYDLPRHISVLGAFGVAAVYFVAVSPWRMWWSARKRIDELQAELNKPRVKQREQMAAHLGEMRARLVAHIGTLKSETLRWFPADGQEAVPSSIHSHASNTRMLIEQFSHEPEFRQAALDFVQGCYIVVDKRKMRDDWRAAAAELASIERRLLPLLHA